MKYPLYVEIDCRAGYSRAFIAEMFGSSVLEEVEFIGTKVRERNDSKEESEDG